MDQTLVQHPPRMRQPRQRALLGTRQRVDGEMLLRRVIDRVKGVDEVVADDAANVAEHFVVSPVAVNNVGCAKAFELGLVAADYDDGAETCEGGELGREAAAVASAADDEN